MMFQRVKKLSDIVSKVAFRNIDTFKFCYHGFLFFNSLNGTIFIFDMCPFHTFFVNRVKKSS
jgi:hypothetical protein